MSTLLKRLKSKNLIRCPEWMLDNTPYLVMMGSIAYGVSDDDSDCDVYGFCIPAKEEVFPHLAGHIPGFGKKTDTFNNWQQHGIEDKEKRREYDFSVYGIVRYFHLCMDCNPNMIDSLFVPRRCILQSNAISEMVREKRKIFLNKKSWNTFKGYSYSQMHKMTIKNPEGKRKELVDKYGYDVKFAYHVVRLLNEVEQILTEGDLDLERNREQLKSIRRGDWTREQVEAYFHKKEAELESVYTNSTLRYRPDQKRIKQLLLDCLEHHYGSLENCVSNVNKYIQAVTDIREVLSRI